MADFQDQKKVVDVTLFLRSFRPNFFNLFFSFKKRSFGLFLIRIQIEDLDPDPKPDPNPKLTEGRIRIRNRIRNKSFGSATLDKSIFLDPDWIRIQSSQWIWIRIQESKMTPQKKVEKFHVLKCYF